MSKEQAEAWRERGALLREQGRLAEAEAALRRALEVAPDDGRTLAELAHVLRWQDRPEEACEAAERAATLAPTHASPWFNRGAALVALGRVEDGIRSYRRALDLEPEFAEAWSNLGEALAATGDHDAAIEACRRSTAANPGLAPAWSNLGGVLVAAGRPEEAVAACRRAVEIDPSFAAAWNNLGDALRETGAYGEAARACERALELAPGLAEAWSNLGAALMEQGDDAASLAAHDRALALAPRSARVQYNRGLALERGRRHDAALAAYRRALDCDGDFAPAGLRLASLLLLRGEFDEGWRAYEWRWRMSGAPPRRYDFSPWSGQREAGRRLLLWGEQGVGDEILHASMVAELAAAGLEVTLEVDPRLTGLMRRSLPKVAVIAREEEPAPDAARFDWQCPLASLGRWLRPSFNAFPRRAYLAADAARTRDYGSRLLALGAGKRVGISWRSANRDTGSDKSVPLDHWAPLLRTPGCAFVDLQYGETAGERDALRRREGLALHRIEGLDPTQDLDGLAALCAACDLVITVSNVTAHLAGALGRPVWLLAPAANGRIWYWFHGRRDSPWYPGLRIFEQARARDWLPVLDAVARELAAFHRPA